MDPTGHFAWDMFVDVISFSSSFATFVVNPTKENLLWAAIDAAALAIPNVSSPMLRAAAATVGEALAKTPIPELVEAAGGVMEAVTKAADDIVAAVKQADVADDVVVKAKTGRGQSRAVEVSQGQTSQLAAMEKTANAALSVKAKKIIDNIPSTLKRHGQCDTFARAFAAALDKNNVDYRIIKVTSTDLIYSDRLRYYVGNGYHYGIQVGDRVYDNLTTGGMLRNDWLTDLGLMQGIPGLAWKYVAGIKGS